MKDMDEQIQRIEDKVLQLLNEYNRVQKEIQQLHKENNRLNELLQAKTIESDKINQKDNLFRKSTGNLDNSEKKILEKRIESYLKDIDKCLALLHS